jgi:Domain of unknown function (DUF1707)
MEDDGANVLPGANKRVGDAERNGVIEWLSKAYAAGQLTESEFNARLDVVSAAKTRADLHAVVTDLPPLPQPAKATDHKDELRMVLVVSKVAAIAVVLFVALLLIIQHA